jgi:hypothetical protein
MGFIGVIQKVKRQKIIFVNKTTKKCAQKIAIAF